MLSTARHHKIFLTVSILLVFLNAPELTGQVTKKEILATRIEQPPRIDGILDDPVWENVHIYRDIKLEIVRIDGKLYFFYLADINAAELYRRADSQALDRALEEHDLHAFLLEKPARAKQQYSQDGKPDPPSHKSADCNPVHLFAHKLSHIPY